MITVADMVAHISDYSQMYTRARFADFGYNTHSIKNRQRDFLHSCSATIRKIIINLREILLVWLLRFSHDTKMGMFKGYHHRYMGLRGWDEEMMSWSSTIYHCIYQGYTHHTHVFFKLYIIKTFFHHYHHLHICSYTRAGICLRLVTSCWLIAILPGRKGISGDLSRLISNDSSKQNSMEKQRSLSSWR